MRSDPSNSATAHPSPLDSSHARRVGDSRRGSSWSACDLEICTHGWQKDDGKSTILNRMVRIKAFILIVALIVAPVASLCATQSGMSAECPRLCPMHGKMGTHTSAGQTGEMDCHHG